MIGRLALFALAADFRGNAVSAENGAPAVGHFGQFFHENRAQLAQLVHHVLVVDDFLADIDRRTIEIQRDLDHIDRAHDAGAESARLEQIDLLSPP